MSTTGTIQIDINGEQYETELTASYLENRKYQIADKSIVKSSIPGLITEIKVKVGDKIKKGKPIFILEAMKMLNEFTLNYDVEIEEILIEKGDIIVKDQPLFKVFPLED